MRDKAQHLAEETNVSNQGQQHVLGKASRLEGRIAGYLDHPDPADWVVPPGLGAQAGVLGALALARDAASPV